MVISRVKSMAKKGQAYKNNNTAPAARIRRVVFDHAPSTPDLVYSQASSTVISPVGTDIVAVDFRSKPGVIQTDHG